MKVYVVTSGEYSGYHIEGVFLDKTKAEFAASFFRLDGGMVEEYDTVDDRTGTEVVRWVKVIIRRGTEFVVWNRDSGPFVPLDDPPHDDYYIAELTGERDRDEVYLKIAQDRHAQWRADQAGIA